MLKGSEEYPPIMQFSIERSVLLSALQKIQMVVEKKNTIEILGNVLLEAREGRFSLCATALEMGLRVFAPAEILDEGRTTVSAKQFLDIVRELPSQTISLYSQNNERIEMRCGKARFCLPTTPAEQYPTFPKLDDKEYYQASTEALKEMIDRTHFAASTDATFQHLNGVYLEPLENRRYRTVATDGYRLSLIDRELFLKNPPLDRGVIVPKKGLLELKKLLQDETVGLAFENGCLFVQLKDSYFFIRFIDGNYLDYHIFMQKKLNRVIILDRVAFTSALKRMSIFANEKSHAVKLHIQEGSLLLSSSQSDVGEGQEEMEALYQGDSLEIVFNFKYLLDDLTILKADQVELHFQDAKTTSVLKEVGRPEHTYLIMPMQID
jgi:DNA polymerase-3 subunit beta